MNNPFDHISGQIRIKGRSYSAKEVIRGLLEQGINITESSEGLKIGFKHFSPLSPSRQILEENNTTGCPFMSSISDLTARIDEISSRLDSQPHKSTAGPPFDLSPPKSPSSSPFSPFNNQTFQSSSRKEQEKFLGSGSSLLDKHQKCSSCGAILPQNAFFCNKCGSHTRSG
jgi:hypothetical protein